jgi:uncharacterized protein YkwD
MKKQNTKHRKQRLGKHHRRGKEYHSIYWPYIPILFLLAGAFFFSQYIVPMQRDVLAFATSMSRNGLLDETNRQRERFNAAPLRLNSNLSEAAQAKAEDMASRNYWSHTTPDGKQPWVFIEKYDYQYSKAGENLAYGFLNPRETVAGWMNSPSHRDNLLDYDFRDVGFGYVNIDNYQNNGNQTVVVALYGTTENIPLVASENKSEPQPSINTSPETPQPVNRLQAIGGDRFNTWHAFGLGIIGGTSAMGLFASHGIRLRKLIGNGKNFALHHPLLDVCLITTLLLCAFLLQTIGHIQ